jgi:hypothetical protein
MVGGAIADPSLTLWTGPSTQLRMHPWTQLRTGSRRQFTTADGKWNRKRHKLCGCLRSRAMKWGLDLALLFMLHSACMVDWGVEFWARSDTHRYGLKTQTKIHRAARPGLSRVRRKSHARLLGEGAMAKPLPYPISFRRATNGQDGNYSVTLEEGC